MPPQTKSIIEKLYNHSEPSYPHAIHTIAFAPDGRTVLSGGCKGTLKLWNVASGQEIRIFPSRGKPYSSCVLSVAFSPDGQRAASGDTDGVIILWGAE
uniref:WD domain-containing protein, G-beta repeat-containing protein n=1 Tax=Candidatus Kentrum sp. FW TaxID=2126338 RepID=A0A450TUU0_9GAMM|nr:MAG: WD domain-containing protein, G-beta repeat-containing protein [Candidatus Kentron sp. FW]